MAGPRPHAPGSPRRHRAGLGSSSVAARTVAARGPAPLFLSLAGDYKGKSSANRKRNRRVIPSPPGSSTAQAPRQSPRARRRGEAQQSVGRDDRPCLVQNAAGTTPGAPPAPGVAVLGRKMSRHFSLRSAGGGRRRRSEPRCSCSSCGRRQLRQETSPGFAKALCSPAGTRTRRLRFRHKCFRIYQGRGANRERILSSHTMKGREERQDGGVPCVYMLNHTWTKAS